MPVGMVITGSGFKTVNGKETCATLTICMPRIWRFKTVNGKETCATPMSKFASATEMSRFKTVNGKETCATIVVPGGFIVLAAGVSKP